LYFTASKLKDDKEASHGLNVDQIAAVHLYTQEWPEAQESLYYKLNAALRNSNRAHVKPFFAYLRLLIDAFSKLPKVSASDKLWRGVRADLSKDFKKGKTLYWWAVTSCSTDQTVLDNPQFLGTTGERTMFSITVSHGVHIDSFSAFSDEAEVVLPPGTHLEVVNASNLGDGLHMIELKEIASLKSMLE